MSKYTLIHNLCDYANAYHREFWFFPHCCVSDFLTRRGKQRNHLGTEPVGSQLPAYPGLICPSVGALQP